MSELKLSSELEQFDIKEEYKEYFAGLVHFARRKYRIGEAKAEDCVQSAFLRLLTEGETVISPLHFLYKCVCNNVLDYLKSAPKNKNQTIDDNTELVVSDDNCPFLKLKKEEERKTVRKAVDDLPKIYKEVIELRYYGELKNKKIAEMLDITEEALESRLRRGKALLKTALSFLRE